MSERKSNFCIHCKHYAEGFFTRLCMKDNLAPNPVNGNRRGVPCREVRCRQNDDPSYCQFFVRALPWYARLWNWLTRRSQ